MARSADKTVYCTECRHFWHRVKRKQEKVNHLQADFVFCWFSFKQEIEMRLRQLIVGGDQEDGDIGERPSVWNSAATVTPASSVMDAINNISLGSIFEGIRLRSGNNTLLVSFFLT